MFNSLLGSGRLLRASVARSPRLFSSATPVQSKNNFDLGIGETHDGDAALQHLYAYEQDLRSHPDTKHLAALLRQMRVELGEVINAQNEIINESQSLALDK